jgi:hypothetical protein
MRMYRLNIGLTKLGSNQRQKQGKGWFQTQQTSHGF